MMRRTSATVGIILRMPKAATAPALLVALAFLVPVIPAGRAAQSPAPAPLVLPGERHLSNVRQLTFGGENAEAYFSFDGRRLSFQSNRSHGCDQIYTMNI